MKLIQTSKILKKKIVDVNKKMPYSSKVIENHEFNRLTKINFIVRTAEASTNFTTKKNKWKIYPDLGDEIQKKQKDFKRLIYFVLFVKVASRMMDHKTI